MMAHQNLSVAIALRSLRSQMSKLKANVEVTSGLLTEFHRLLVLFLNNNAKSNLVAAIEGLETVLTNLEQEAPSPTVQQIATIVAALQDALDSDNEVSEMASMQLQMLMDARSKLLQTASDVEKALSETEMAIVGNIKQ